MKSLIIGFGSAGKKHFKSLKKIKKIKKIKILSSLKINKKFLIKKKEIISYDPDYILITNLTKLHYQSLSYIDHSFQNKLIFVEKPIFHKYINFKSKNNNKIIVGYNLRHNPVIDFLKKKFRNKKINHVKIECKSYLPSWRKNLPYHKTNTAQRIGGGALLELSHEIDYMIYIFGKFKVNYKFKKKLSKLKIENEDIYQINGFSKNVKFFSIYVNLFDKRNERKISIYTDNNLTIGDINKNYIKIINKEKVKVLKFTKKNTFDEQHKEILSKNFSKTCNLNDALNILKIIEKKL